MTINDLINDLEYIRDTHEDGGDYNVVAALQPTYPMRGRIVNICTDPSENQVYIAMSNNEGYGVPRCVWEDSEIYDSGEDED